MFSDQLNFFGAPEPDMFSILERQKSQVCPLSKVHAGESAGINEAFFLNVKNLNEKAI
jgi:hypothetical protein